MQSLHGSRSSGNNPIVPSSAVSPEHPEHGSTVMPRDCGRSRQVGHIIAKIEDILIANLDALAESRAMTIPIRSRTTGNTRQVPFPSARQSDAKKFTALLQILHLSHEALVAGTVITKRAIYYQNPELFGSQQYVNELIDDIAFTFGVGRDALNIVASGKGLIAGAIKLTVGSSSVLDCNSGGSQGVLLPNANAVTDITLGTIRWLLVIEKEATFRGLVASTFQQTATIGPGILITARGYPDLSTRQFLHKMHSAFPTLPMYGLVDFDPDGVRIMLTYKNGSRSLQHEENVTLSELQWIGLRSNHMLRQHSASSPNPQAPCGRAGSISSFQALLPLKSADRDLATRMLSLRAGSERQISEHLDVIHELQVMLMLNTKAEIESVDEGGDLTTWLDRTLIEMVGTR